MKIFDLAQSFCSCHWKLPTCSYNYLVSSALVGSYCKFLTEEISFKIINNSQVTTLIFLLPFLLFGLNPDFELLVISPGSTLALDLNISDY